MKTTESSSALILTNETQSASIDDHTKVRTRGSTLILRTRDGFPATSHAIAAENGSALTLTKYRTDPRPGNRYFSGDESLLWYHPDFADMLVEINYGQTWATDEEIGEAIYRKFVMASFTYAGDLCGYSAETRTAYMIQAKADRIADAMNHLYDTTQYEYNPIENYDMEETTTYGHVATATRSGSETDGGSNVRTGSADSVASQYPVNNSGASKPVSDDKTTYNNVTDTISNTRTYNNVEDKTIHSGTDGLTRHGNIGVTTSQQMIESERSIILRMMDAYTDEYAEFFQNRM